MSVSRDKRAQRLEASRSLRAKAPIAAQFEDCFQAFQQLSDSLQVKESNSKLHGTAKDCEHRLTIWGDESGASSRVLDYVLRKSPVVRGQTFRLLKDLESILERAIGGVRLQALGDPDTEDEFEAATTAKPLSPVNIKDDTIQDDPDAEITPEAHLEEIKDILGYLNQLLPALRDPLEEDSHATVANDTDMFYEEAYQQLATMMFPTASKRLVQRLGQSNWRRRQALSHSLDELQTSETRPDLRRPIKGSLAPWNSQLRWAKNASKNYSMQHQSNLVESKIRTSTVVSSVDTVLVMKPLASQDSSTSFTDTSQAPVLHLINLPDPPVDLAKAEQFDCPYCRSVLPLRFSSNGLSKEEWAAHVYSDLKPYMCTFDNCTYEGKLYGDKNEWFQHELNFHRSRLVWSCNLCQNDFTTANQLDAHLRSFHAGLSSKHLNIIQESCQRYSNDPYLEQPCILCGFVCENIDELESHLGSHLESFALATLLNDEMLDEEDLESYETIADYFAGLPESHEYDDRTMPDAIPDDLEETGEGHWNEKVKTFLDNQSLMSDVQLKVRLNVPSRYENFVGRDADLQNIHKHLSTPGRICTVSGRGGIGKTAIAVEYLHKYDLEYSYVFWVEAEAPGLCAEKYGTIADSLNLTEKPPADEVTRTYFVREHLAKSEYRWLLVLDNAASWMDIARYIPRNLHRTKGSVLITSRAGPPLSTLSQYPLHYYQRAIELDVWPMEHGREFLLTSIQPKLNRRDLGSHDEYGLATQVVDVVGRLPLAVSMIVGYIKVSRCTLADFLEMWEEREYGHKGKRMTGVNDKDIDIDEIIDSLWAIGIREVRMNSRRLLDILAFLDPETIQKSLIVGDHKEKYLEFLNSSETLIYKRMINELSGRRLLSVKETSTGKQAYTIHRLLQHKILLDMEDYAFADAFRKAFRLIRKRFPVADPQQVPDPQDWEACQEYIPHVFTFCHIYNQNQPMTSIVEPKPMELAGLFYDAGFYVWARQTTAYDGLFFLNTAERILDDIQTDPNAKIRADILCLTGVLLLNSGCVERAQGLIRLEQAWLIRKNIYLENPDHDNDVLLLNATNDYSNCLLDEHRFEDAGKLIRGCRDQYLIWGPESAIPFENSKYYGNYCIVLMWKGEMAKAIEFQECAIQLTEKFSGKKALYYRRAFTLANLLLQSGDVQGALDKHLEVLAARLELYGKHQEQTILSTYAVGAMYHHLGDLDTATKYIQQCIESVKISNWGAEAFARAKYHLALLYREQGIEEETAATLEEEAIQVLDEFGNYAAECVRGVDDKMMILDDLQPTFLGRYTGRNLLKHLRKCLGQQDEKQSKELRITA